MNLALAKNYSVNNEYSGRAISSLSDKELLSRLASLVRQERQIIENLIWHLQEVQERKLYISLGYTSLHDCLVKHFGYSAAAAYAKLSALKIITAVPEAAQALNKGEVTLTTLSLAQSFIRKQEQESGDKVSVENKLELLRVIKNKTTQEVKQTLAEINPAMDLPHDKVNYLTADDIQLLITTDKALLAKIEKLKALISHEDVNPSYSKLLHMAFDALIEKKEKAKGFKTSKDKSEAAKPDSTVTQCESIKSVEAITAEGATQIVHQKNTRTVSRAVKRNVLARSQGRCEFIHQDGKRCNSDFQLQFDHVLAFSKGGGSNEKNIQNLCRVHNNFKGNS